MNREIKFRAYMKDINLVFTEEVVSIEIRNGKITQAITAGEMGSSVMREEDGDVFMQYTGLKDKNGKEIYEGDVCKVKLNPKLIPNGVIDWDCGKAVYLWSWQDIISKRSYNLSSVTHELEIIGNIYENPELLEAYDD